MLSLSVLSLLILSLACGGGGDDDDDGGDDGGDGTPAATTPAGDDDDVGGEPVVFDVSMTDNVYAPGEFSVPAGSTVTFNLTNDGAAIHNLRLSGEDGEYNTDDDALSDPDLVTGGGEAVLEWIAPDEPGEVIFQCDFHPTDMLGVITVE